MRTVCVCCLSDACALSVFAACLTHAHCVCLLACLTRMRTVWCLVPAQMLSALVQSADTEMLQRANGMIESITCKMAVDVENLCKHFTRKEPKKKSVSVRAADG